MIDSMEMAIDFRRKPRRIFEAKDVFVAGEKRTPHSNYLNGVQWCPDGGRLLTASADKRWQRRPYVVPDDVTCGSRFRIFDVAMPEESEGTQTGRPVTEIIEGEMIFDYCWYPYADASNPQTYCFLSTSRVRSASARVSEGHGLDGRITPSIFGMHVPQGFVPRIDATMLRMRFDRVCPLGFLPMDPESTAVLKTVYISSILRVRVGTTPLCRPSRKRTAECEALSQHWPSRRQIHASMPWDLTMARSVSSLRKRTRSCCVCWVTRAALLR